MSNLPTIQTENRPPLLRFVSLAVEDRFASEESGQVEYKDVIKVYVRAAGDTKCEVPFIAKETVYEPRTAVVDVQSTRMRNFRDGNGDMSQKEEAFVERKEEVLYDKKVIYPWIAQLKDKLKNGWVSQEYFDFCEKALDRFMRNEDAPVVGIPLVEWRGAPESIKKKAIDIGINSVELAAEMTEEAMQAIGIGARDLKNKAIAFIEADKAPNKAAQKIVNLEAKNAALMERLEALERVARDNQEVKKSPGRPRKEEAEAA